MSFCILTDNFGNSYQLSLGDWITSPAVGDYFMAIEALERIDYLQLSAAEDELFRVMGGDLDRNLFNRPGSRWQDVDSVGVYTSHTHHLHIGVGFLPGRWPLILDAIYHGSLRFTQTGTAKKSKEVTAQDSRSLLRVKIRQALFTIVAVEKTEAAHHTKLLRQETSVSRGLIYTGAFLTGLWRAGEDFAQWLKEVNDVLSPLQRSLRGVRATHRALQRSDQGEGLLSTYRDEILTAEKREIVQVLGFDPTAITRQQFQHATELADLIWEDSALQSDLRRFVKDYVSAQHAIEITEFSGAAAFEVLFTILLAAVTGGAGLATSAASQARCFARFRKVGELLVEFGEQVKKARMVRDRNAPAKQSPGFEDFESLGEVEVISNGVSHATAPRSRPKLSTQASRADAPKRLRPEPDNWETYRTRGVDQSPLESEVGRAMVESLESQGLERQQAIMKAQEYIASGSDLPVPMGVKKGDRLYKLVPEGESPGKFSAYFADKSEIDKLEGVSYDEVTDRIGIPLESQQTSKFNLFEVEAMEDTTVFQSTIAPTTQNGYSQPGGGKQTLVLNRSLFSEPKNTGRKYP